MSDPSCKSCPRSRVSWLVIALAWTLLRSWGTVAALFMPFNLVLVPCWLACASSVGPLARKLLDPKCSACGSL